MFNISGSDYWVLNTHAVSDQQEEYDEHHDYQCGV